VDGVGAVGLSLIHVCSGTNFFKRGFSVTGFNEGGKRSLLRLRPERRGGHTENCGDYTTAP